MEKRNQLTYLLQPQEIGETPFDTQEKSLEVTLIRLASYYPLRNTGNFSGAICIPNS